MVLPAALVGLAAAGREGNCPCGAGLAMLCVGGIPATAAGIVATGETGRAILPKTAFVGLGFAPSAVLFVVGGLVTWRGARRRPERGAEPAPESVPAA